MTKDEIDHAAKQVLNALPMSEGSSEWALAHAAITKELRAAHAAGAYSAREDAYAASELRKWALEQAIAARAAGYYPTKGSTIVGEAATILAFANGEQPAKP